MKRPWRAFQRPAISIAIAAVFLAACAPVADRATPTSRNNASVLNLPPVKSFARSNPQAPQRANKDMIRDFLDLHFRLEGGTELPVFTRFEEPITLRLTGTPSPGLQADLNRLLSRLQREAGVPIHQTTGSSAHITLQSVSGEAIRRVLPKAACFVVPNVHSLADLKRKRRSPLTDWAQLRQRKQLAIFIPNDVSPQEARDCLHEELAQAIGPLNDLYRLPDSVFNDDNTHTVLTGFDMLVLRATYAPELKTGMSRSDVEARLPAIFARLNPAGENRPSRPLPETHPTWSAAIEAALGPGTLLTSRKKAANAAVRIARNLGWQDHRRAQSHYVLGRLIQPSKPALAHRHFKAAMATLRKMPGTELQQAVVGARLAAFDIARGDGSAALARITPTIAAASRYENAALLANALLIKAEALELQGNLREANALRLDSLGWARYGFGPDWTSQLVADATSDPGSRTN